MCSTNTGVLFHCQYLKQPILCTFTLQCHSALKKGAFTFQMQQQQTESCACCLLCEHSSTFDDSLTAVWLLLRQAAATVPKPDAKAASAAEIGPLATPAVHMGPHANTAPTFTPQGAATPEGGSPVGSTAQSAVTATDPTAVTVQEAAGGDGAVLKVCFACQVCVDCL